MSISAASHHAVGSGPAGLRARIDAVAPARLFALLYALALAVTLAFGFAWRFRHGPDGLEYDEREYWDLSTRLLGGHLDLLPRRTAAFPLILAALRLATPGFTGVQVGVAALFAFAAPILFLLARRLSGGNAAGLAAGAAFALWPPTTFYGATLYSEPVALPLFLLALWLRPVGGRGPAPRAAFGAGLVLALATQVRTMYLLFLPFLVLALLVEARWRPVALARCGWALAGFAVVTAPWSAYMTARFGHPILVTANGGETLSGGLGPRLFELDRQSRTLTSDRSTWIGPGKWLPITASGYLSPAELAHLPYDRQDALLKRRALAWAAAHPADALRLEGCKLLYMWGALRIGDNGAAQLLFGGVPILLLLAAAAAALARAPWLWARAPRLWLVPVFVSGVALISWGSWRFRQPADAALIALVAIGWLRPGRPPPGAARDG